jgi:hypothetical protein
MVLVVLWYDFHFCVNADLGHQRSVFGAIIVVERVDESRKGPQDWANQSSGTGQAFDLAACLLWPVDRRCITLRSY